MIGFNSSVFSAVKWGSLPLPRALQNFLFLKLVLGTCGLPYCFSILGTLLCWDKAPWWFLPLCGHFVLTSPHPSRYEFPGSVPMAELFETEWRKSHKSLMGSSLSQFPPTPPPPPERRKKNESRSAGYWQRHERGCGKVALAAWQLLVCRAVCEQLIKIAPRHLPQRSWVPLGSSTQNHTLRCSQMFSRAWLDQSRWCPRH